MPKDKATTRAMSATDILYQGGIAKLARRHGITTGLALGIACGVCDCLAADDYKLPEADKEHVRRAGILADKLFSAVANKTGDVDRFPWEDGR